MSTLVPVYGIVYLITCLVNGKLYVGQTTRGLRVRFSRHIYDAFSPISAYRDNPLYRSIRKYGEVNFKVEILCSCQTAKELDLMEDSYIVAFDTMNSSKGYNLKRGGVSGKVSEFTKKKQSDNTKGSKNPRYLHDVKSNEVSKLYLSGKGTVEVAKILGISQKAVAGRLAELGIPARRTGHPGLTLEDKKVVSARMKIHSKGENNPAYRHDVSTEEIISLRTQGLNFSEIARIVSVSHGTVRKRLIKSGFVLEKAPREIAKDAKRISEEGGTTQQADPLRLLVA